MDFTISIDILREIMTLIIPSTFIWAFVTRAIIMVVRAATGRNFIDE